VAQLTTLLDLTSGQQATATTIFTTEQTALESIQTSEQTAQTALQTAITSNSPTGISNAAATIGTLATEQAEAVGTGEAAFYIILTAAQQAKYDVLGANGGPGAPGGQGGPPGPPPGGHPGAPGPSGASGYSGGGHH
jgi:Spy/CpxP family protein refolding chaperone